MLPHLVNGADTVVIQSRSGARLASKPFCYLRIGHQVDNVLPDGACVRVDAKVDERSLRRVLRVLRER